MDSGLRRNDDLDLFWRFSAWMLAFLSNKPGVAVQALANDFLT